MLNKDNDKWTIKNIKTTVKLLKDNEVYRLGDGIKFRKSHKIIKQLLKNPKYDGTILKMFHQDPSRKPNLYEIVKRKKDIMRFICHNDDELMVHIRLGDDIKNRGLGNTKNFDFFVNEINESKCNKVTIVTALHYGTSSQPDSLYKTGKYNYKETNHNDNIQKLYELICKLNKPVIIISNEDVDLDVLHLVFCHNLLTSTTSGSFSKLVKSLHAQFISASS